MAKQNNYFGSIIPATNFNPAGDASLLRNAMKGAGTDEARIIQVTTTRVNSQRQEIKVAFKRDYQRDLIEDLKSELSGHFRDVIVGLYMLPAEFAAKSLHKAMKGLGTSESTLVEVLATCSNEEIKQTNQFYQRNYNQVLATDLMAETSGDFRTLLVAMNAASRDSTGKVDVANAAAYAQHLYAAGEERLGTDEQTFINIFTSNNYPQLRQIFIEYEKVAKKDIVDSIASEFSGDIKNGLITIAEIARNPSTYFAKGLHKSMKGIGTNDDKLVRIMVSRSEIDLAKINDEYKSLYNQALGDAIKSDTSGDYKTTLLALLPR